MVVDVLDFTLIKTSGILCNVFLIVEQQLALHLQCTLKIIICHEFAHYSRHSTNYHIFTKSITKHIHLNRRQWLCFFHLF